MPKSRIIKTETTSKKQNLDSALTPANAFYFKRYGATFAIRKDCLPNITLKRYLAQGAEGTLHAACKDEQKNCNIVVKLVPIVPYDHDDNDQNQTEYLFNKPLKSKLEKISRLKKEFTIAADLGEWKIGPAVHYHAVCSGYIVEPIVEPCYIGVLVMDAKTATLQDYRSVFGDQQDEEIMSLLVKVIRRMIKHGYRPGDPHAQNVMLDIDTNGNVLDVVLIDFEDAQKLSQTIDPIRAKKIAKRLAREFIETDF
jgi:hypothetical protein